MRTMSEGTDERSRGDDIPDTGGWGDDDSGSALTAVDGLPAWRWLAALFVALFSYWFFFLLFCRC